MTEFKRATDICGKSFQKDLEPCEIFAEIRRTLKQNNAQLPAHRPGGVYEIIGFVAGIAQTLDVGDLLWGFEGKAEVLRDGGCPRFNHFLLR